jgi:hypothetical protein
MKPQINVHGVRLRVTDPQWVMVAASNDSDESTHNPAAPVLRSD